MYKELNLTLIFQAQHKGDISTSKKEAKEEQRKNITHKHRNLSRLLQPLSFSPSFSSVLECEGGGNGQ
jgi:hypothetical protein